MVLALSSYATRGSCPNPQTSTTTGWGGGRGEADQMGWGVLEGRRCGCSAGKDVRENTNCPSRPECELASWFGGQHSTLSVLFERKTNDTLKKKKKIVHNAQRDCQSGMEKCPFGICSGPSRNSGFGEVSGLLRVLNPDSEGKCPRRC